MLSPIEHHLSYIAHSSITVPRDLQALHLHLRYVLQTSHEIDPVTPRTRHQNSWPRNQSSWRLPTRTRTWIPHRWSWSLRFPPAKLQVKLNSLQIALIATQREPSNSQQLTQLAETRIADAQEYLEKPAILEVENDVLKQGSVGSSLFFCFRVILIFGHPTEGSVAGDSPAIDSLAYIQLEKQVNDWRRLSSSIPTPPLSNI